MLSMPPAATAPPAAVAALASEHSLKPDTRAANQQPGWAASSSNKDAPPRRPAKEQPGNCSSATGTQAWRSGSCVATAAWGPSTAPPPPPPPRQQTSRAPGYQERHAGAPVESCPPAGRHQLHREQTTQRVSGGGVLVLGGGSKRAAAKRAGVHTAEGWERAAKARERLVAGTFNHFDDGAGDWVGAHAWRGLMDWAARTRKCIYNGPACVPSAQTPFRHSSMRVYVHTCVHARTHGCAHACIRSHTCTCTNWHEHKLYSTGIMPPACDSLRPLQDHETIGLDGVDDGGALQWEGKGTLSLGQRLR